MAPKSDSKNSKKRGKDGPKTLTKRHAFAIATMMMIALMTFLTAFVLIGYSALKYRYIGDGPLKAERSFEVPKGAGLSRVANALESSGAIASANIFKLFVKLDGGETSLKAGEYALPAEASMRDIYEILKDGQAILYPITFAEGLTSAQIVRVIKDAPNLSGNVSEIPAEGTLLPETYMLPKTMSKAELVAKMSKAQSDLLDELWDNRAENLPIKTKQEALILASIVEKETAVADERPTIAGVFINRLRKGMKLQTDPTVIYGMGDAYQGNIRKKDLKTDTPWNTYTREGLPPTPISTAGREAIEAVLHPEKTSALFFVASGGGRHTFTETYEEHRQAVIKYQLGGNASRYKGDERTAASSLSLKVVKVLVKVPKSKHSQRCYKIPT